MKEKLAINGGQPVFTAAPNFGKWPLLTQEDEDSVLDVLRSRAMSGTNVTEQFEQEYAQWQGAKFVLASNNGTSALHSAMFALGLKRGDEVITTTWTYWATHAALSNLGLTAVFADIDPRTLCLDAEDVAKRITERTRAVIVTHMFGYPADMDAFTRLAAKHNLKILEDYSHSHGSTWDGRKVGSFGYVAAASIMTGKPLGTGEGGVFNTEDQEAYERAIVFGHYERVKQAVKNPDLQRYAGLSLGGFKYRMHQLTSALARVRLKYYDQDRAPGVQALEHLFRLCSDIPGVSCNFPLNHPKAKVGSSYCQRFILADEIIQRVPNTVIAEAVSAEGLNCSAGGYYCHHLHPFWNDCDVYGDGRPTRIAFSDRDVRQKQGDCPVAEKITQRLISVPRFTAYNPELVEQAASVYHKVFSNLDQLENRTSQAGTERFTSA